MSRVCCICGKGKQSGNTVSHSHRLARRAWNANVQKVRIIKDGHVENCYVCAKCLKNGKVERA